MPIKKIKPANVALTLTYVVAVIVVLLSTYVWPAP